MNKSKISLKLLICVLIMIALSSLLVACNIGGAAHFDHLVTFDYNKGNINGTANTQYLGVMNNGYVSARPGYSSDLSLAVIDGYYLDGWFLPAEVDEEGNPKKDDDGFVILGEEWNFKTMRVTEDITLYGKWVKKITMHFIDRKTNEELVGGADSFEPTIRKPGDILDTAPNGLFAPQKKGYTFLGKFYVSADSDEEFSFPYTFGDTDVNVYVDMLEGEYVLVDTPLAFKNAIQTNRNIYLMADIDCENKLIYTWSLGTYSGEINGAGHKVLNLTRDMTAARNNQSNFGGLFGTLGAKAYIHDVTFVNISLTFKIDVSMPSTEAIKVGLFAWKAEQGARVENVTLTGTLKYKQSNRDVTYEKFVGDNKMNNTDIKDCDYDSVTVVVQ